MISGSILYKPGLFGFTASGEKHPGAFLFMNSGILKGIKM
jgi:hypothetical protein